MPKMNVNLYVIEDYENETAFRLQKKQTQTNPTCSELVEPISKYYPNGKGRKKSLWEAAEKAILLFYVAKRANPALYSENTPVRDA